MRIRALKVAIAVTAFCIPLAAVLPSGGMGVAAGYIPVVTAELGGGLSAGQGSFYGGGSVGFGFAAVGGGGAGAAFLKFDAAYDFTGSFAHFRAGPEVWFMPFTLSLEYLNLNGSSGVGLKAGYLLGGTQIYTRWGVAGGGVINIGVHQLLHSI